jgi:hypothetical protein
VRCGTDSAATTSFQAYGCRNLKNTRRGAKASASAKPWRPARLSVHALIARKNAGVAGNRAVEDSAAIERVGIIRHSNNNARTTRRRLSCNREANNGSRKHLAGCGQNWPTPHTFPTQPVCVNCGADPLVRSRPPGRLARQPDQVDFVGEERVQGDPCRPGGPPHNLTNADREAMRKVCGIISGRCSVAGKVCGIGQNWPPYKIKLAQYQTSGCARGAARVCGR